MVRANGPTPWVPSPYGPKGHGERGEIFSGWAEGPPAQPEKCTTPQLCTLAGRRGFSH